MIRSSILGKLLLTALVLILVALGSADFFLTRYTADREVRHAEQLMDGQVRILAPALAAVPLASVRDWTSRAASQSRARVTIIDRDGVVLADSEHDPATMENHGQRPEVLQALAGQTGAAVRRSATLDVDLCYLAIPAALAEKPGVILRLAVPLQQIKVSIAEVRWLIVRASLIAGLCALLIAYFISRAFTNRIRRIQSFAGELVNADYSGTIATQAEDELGSVARSLRGMADQFREMLRRLSDEASRRKAILASMVEGVLAVDAELRVTFCNDSFAHAVNARQPLPEGIPLLQIVREPALLDLLKRVLATGEPRRQRMSILAAQARVFDVQAAPLEDRRRGAIAILHDVTELERLERVRKDFIANISHELRTPLASVRGYTETLLDGALEDRENNRKFLEVIYSNAIRLGDMASDLLALSEMEAEREPPPAESLSVREVVRAAIRTVEAEARTRNVEIIPLEVEDLHILGQRFRLEHALLNLLHNAIRFNRPGGEVRVEARSSDSRARIIVTDTGIGIPFEDLPRIFERFYCVDKARSRETGGTGLGLAIVKHVTEKMGGTVTVESRLGKGSTFTLEFPAEGPSPGQPDQRD